MEILLLTTGDIFANVVIFMETQLIITMLYICATQ